jgi:energy-coupling factor transporter ATP-binding protein EcfA2
MQLKQLVVHGLFRQYNYTIPFPLRSEDNPNPSVVLLCGENGVGKTRLLRMLDGFLKLDFTAFREVPFKFAELTFSNDTAISVKPMIRKKGKVSIECLRVKYKKNTVDIHPTHRGWLFEEESEKIEAFNQAFEEDTSSISLRFVSTGRLQNLYDEHEAREQEKERRENHAEIYFDGTVYTKDMPNRPQQHNILLLDRIRRFIRDAQLNYRRYFSSRSPNLFPKILESLTEKSMRDYSATDLIDRINVLMEQDNVSDQYGLYKELWNPDKLKRILLLRGQKAPDMHALTVANTYIEFLESRASERLLLVNRLQTFEKSANEFLKNKSIAIHMRHGLRIIEMKQGSEIEEARLSSGEYHLLYLLVTAVTTQRRGTVIAIDEPEISMHLGWQRKLLPAILECASMAQPQVIIATHSPEITYNFSDACVHLGS